MPQHKSAKKSVRQNERRRLINRQQKGILKSSIKNVFSAVEEKDSNKAQKAFSSAASEIDKMAAKGIIHKNNAANKPKNNHKTPICREDPPLFFRNSLLFNSFLNFSVRCRILHLIDQL